MTRIHTATAIFLTAWGLGACDLIRGTSATTSRPTTAAQGTQAAAPAGNAAATAAASQSAGAVLQGARQSVAALDTTTPEEKAAAAAPTSGGGQLGTTVASLGDATEGGFWLKTPLVSAPAKGRIVNTENGQSANVDLQPLGGGGSGSQISLAAMQTIGASLTDLPELEVWQN